MLHLIIHRYLSLNRLLQSLFVVVLMCSCSAFADVRILLDISRSMAESDPSRVRNEALELLLSSIPNGEKAGIWTFGRYVNLLMPHETVNAAWRAEAERRLNAQTYPAIRTNIGRALEEAAYDFNYSAYQGDVDIILVTDGKADIAPNEEVNRIERGRILNQLIPEYERAGARIHTLALSDNADLPLLRQLAEQTGGHYQLIKRPADLTVALMRLSNDATPMTQLTTDAKTFQVDEAISEMTVLMYHSQGAVSLVAPNGEVNSAVQPGRQRWRVGNGFSQVTVFSPQKGRWQVKGDINSNSAIRIISDIKAQWQQPVRTVLAHGSVLDIRAELVDGQGRNILDRLNSLIQVAVRVDGKSVPVQVDAQAIHARYQPDIKSMGTQLELSIDGGTFNRLLTRQIRYVEPFISEVLLTKDGYQWRIYPNRYLNDDDIQFTASVRYETDSGEQQQSFVRTEAGYWLFQLPNDLPAGDYRLEMEGYYLADQSMTQLPSETVQVSLPLNTGVSIAMTPEMMTDAMPAQQVPDMNSPAEFVKDLMPEFEELQTDLVVNEPTDNTWEEEPVDILVEESESSGQWFSYVLLTLPGLLVLAGVYFVYRRIEQRAKLHDVEDEVILGGDEFASLDNVDHLMRDSDLDIEVLEEDPDEIMDDEELEPVEPESAEDFAEPSINQDIEQEALAEDLPTPAQTEAPSPAQEDMLDASEDISDIDEEGPGELDADEDLFDISSIDDDLADLDLALDGDDPFAEPDDTKPEN